MSDVTPTDNFFDLGGHSLLALRLIGQIQHQLGLESTLRELYENPTPAALVDCLVTSATRPGRVPGTPPTRPPRIPLSHAQERLWFFSRMTESLSYDEPMALRMSGDLNVDALERALDDVVQRHEALRTIFPQDDDGPHQVILDRRLSLPRAQVREQDLHSVLRSTVRRLDITKDPPFAAQLFVLGEQEHVLLLVVHHIAVDGWSLGPLIRDLSYAYGRRLAGHEPGWSPLLVQYPDFALWQRSMLGDPSENGSPLAHQLDHWRHTLSALPDEIVPTPDRPRGTMASHAGATITFSLDARLHQELLGLARRSRASLFMVLHTGLVCLLIRSGAGRDVAIGTPMAGRADGAFDDTIGLFLNMLVLRTPVAGDPSFEQLLAQVRETDFAAYANGDVPFERVVEAVNPARSTARHPLFQVTMSMQSTPVDAVTLPGLRVTAVAVPTGTAKNDVSFFFSERADKQGIDGVLEYSTALYDEPTAQRLASGLVRILESAVDNAARPVHQIDMLSPADRRWLRDRSAGPYVTTGPESVCDLFEQQVRRSGSDTALVFGSEQLSYTELHERVHDLAGRLAAMSIGPGQGVGVSLSRSPDLVVALLAVLATGATYVPLDPRDPAERLRFTLDDARPTVLLVDAHTGRGFAALRDPTGRIVELDGSRVRPDIGAPSRSILLPRRSPPCAPAYVIYTSGSTGRPKGVVVPHSALSNFLLAAREVVPLTAADGMLSTASPAFDVNLFEVFLPLTSGARLVLTSDVARSDPVALGAVLADPGTTVGFGTPSLWQLLAAECPDKLRRLRAISGGEALPASLAATLTELGCQVVNCYGPTETTIFATGFHTEDGVNPPHIGRPVRNTQAFVLDDDGQLAPVGAAGEIHLAGHALAQSYLNRAGLTAERFLPNPYGSPGSRMYRTGDLGRWSADGQLQFMGRVDQQVKIRGFRVELGEIEETLHGHDDVAQSAATVHRSAAGDDVLIAFVVPRPGHSVDLLLIRRYLAERLPDYMVPARLEVVDVLPTDRNGKLDRKSLAKSRSDGVPPAVVTPAEEAQEASTESHLTRLFAAELGLPTVGLRDNFFHLGGHSLSALRLVNTIRRVLHVDLRLVDFFRAQSIENLVPLLRKTPGDGPEEVAPGDSVAEVSITPV